MMENKQKLEQDIFESKIKKKVFEEQLDDLQEQLDDLQRELIRLKALIKTYDNLIVALEKKRNEK